MKIYVIGNTKTTSGKICIYSPNIVSWALLACMSTHHLCSPLQLQHFDLFPDNGQRMEEQQLSKWSKL